MKTRFCLKYFVNDFCLFLKLTLYERSRTIYVCLLLLELKLNTRQNTAKDRIHLFLIIKCRSSKVVEENKLRVMTTRF